MNASIYPEGKVSKETEGDKSVGENHPRIEPRGLKKKKKNKRRFSDEGSALVHAV